MRKTPIKKISEKRKAQIKEERLLKGRLIILQNGKCAGCHQRPDFKDGRGELHLSHKIPKGMGGTTHEYTIDEVELICRRCHNEKRHRIKESDDE